MNAAEATAKVQKLLRLAQSDNPHEAANAAARAQEIMDRYNLGAISLELEGGAPATPEEPIMDLKAAPLDTGGRLATWKVRLASSIARANQCRVYLYTGVAINIVGRPSDAETVRYLYAYLVRETGRLAERDGAGLGATWRNNFRLGVVETVGNRLREQHVATINAVRAESEARTDIPKERALVLVSTAIERVEKRSKDVDEWMQKEMKLRAGRSTRGGNYNPSARDAGRRAGHEVNIGGNRAIGAGAKALKS